VQNYRNTIRAEKLTGTPTVVPSAVEHVAVPHENPEHKRRKLTAAGSAASAPVAATMQPAPLAQLHKEPAGPVPKARGVPCMWDGNDGCWRDDSGNMHTVISNPTRQAKREATREDCMRITSESLQRARDAALIAHSRKWPCWRRARPRPAGEFAPALGAGGSLIATVRCTAQSSFSAAFLSDERLQKEWWRPDHGYTVHVEGRHVRCTGRGWFVPHERVLCAVLKREGISRASYDSHLTLEVAARRQAEVERVWERDELQRRSECSLVRCNEQELRKHQLLYEASMRRRERFNAFRAGHSVSCRVVTQAMPPLQSEREVERLWLRLALHRCVIGCGLCDVQPDRPIKPGNSSIADVVNTATLQRTSAAVATVVVAKVPHGRGQRTRESQPLIGLDARSRVTRFMYCGRA